MPDNEQEVKEKIDHRIQEIVKWHCPALFSAPEYQYAPQQWREMWESAAAEIYQLVLFSLPGELINPYQHHSTCQNCTVPKDFEGDCRDSCDKFNKPPLSCEPDCPACAWDAAIAADIKATAALQAKLEETNKRIETLQSELETTNLRLKQAFAMLEE